MTAMFERETKREKILESRQRELRLKRQGQSAQGGDGVRAFVIESNRENKTTNIGDNHSEMYFLSYNVSICKYDSLVILLSYTTS